MHGENCKKDRIGILSKTQNIELILSENLCCGCGACAGVCPKDAISLCVQEGYTPVLNRAKCTQCGLCYQVCPGKGYPVRQLADKTDEGDIEFHPKYGPMTGYYRVSASNPDIVTSGASGGAATALLLYLLNSGFVDCVVVPVLKGGIVEPVITKDPAVVRASQGSKYVPVPMARVIADFRREPRKFAMPCTPCQLAAWKLAEQKIPALKGCLKLSIGLFCGYVQSYEGIACLARIMGVDYPAHAQFCGWRCGVYPGHTRFRTETAESIEKSYYSSSDILIPFFSLNRCFLCPDGGNWLADMVLGDVHGEGENETVVLCRTKLGGKILAEAERAEYIIRRSGGPNFLLRSTIDVINRAKMLPVLAVIESLMKKGRIVPVFDLRNMFEQYPEFRRFKKYWSLRYQLICWAKRDGVWQRMERFPYVLEWFGRFLYSFPRTLPGWRYKEFVRLVIIKIVWRFRV